MVAAAAGIGAEQMAGRLFGVFGEHLQILPVGKPFAAFPFADGGNGEAEFDGDLFERNSLFTPPVSEGVGKAPADVAFEAQSRRHDGISAQWPRQGKRENNRAGCCSASLQNQARCVTSSTPIGPKVF